MALLTGGPDPKIKLYEATVVDFVKRETGGFVVASNDYTFLSVLRSTIQKQLAIEEECVVPVLNEDHIIKVLKETATKKKRIVLFIERVMSGKETAFLVKQVKSAFPSVKVVVLTGEAERNQLVLLHEIGADNFISKPISINVLIEKIAFTIKPQGKIGKLIDAAKLKLAHGSYEDALTVCRGILELKPNSAAAFLIMGDAYKGLEEKDKAVESYQLAGEHAQLYLEPLKKLALFYGEEGDSEKQLEYLEMLDKLSPLNVERKVEMGGLHVELGNEGKAEKLFEEAFLQAKREAMAFVEQITTQIADIYQKKDPEKAVRFYRKALEMKGGSLDRSDIRTFNNLGIALRKQGKWREAADEYLKALNVSPEDENLYFNMAMAYAEGKDFESSAHNLEQALELNPDFFKVDHVVAYNFGLIFSKARSPKKAKRFLEYSLKLNPDFESPKRVLEALNRTGPGEDMTQYRM